MFFITLFPYSLSLYLIRLSKVKPNENYLKNDVIVGERISQVTMETPTIQIIKHLYNSAYEIMKKTMIKYLC